jgi:nitrite reductase/ring-hydroxylating ferredoxin subunit
VSALESGVEVDASADARASSKRVKPDLGLAPGWWPVALNAEIGRHPAAFRLGSRDLAVYRDLQGRVRAVDDSCPHRRVPLSMGRITEDGYLQCAYHGWCFDGATGRCTSIPNLKEGEKIPGAIRIDVFATAETVADALGFGLRTNRLAPAVGPPTGEEPDEGTTMFEALLTQGLVLVWTGNDPAPDAITTPAHDEGTRGSFWGSVEVRAPYERVTEALLYNPGAVLGLGALVGSGDASPGCEVEQDDGALVVRRSRLRYGLPRVGTYGPLIDRYVSTDVRMVVQTGLSWVQAPGVSLIVGLTPISQYRTIVRWSGQASGPRLAAGRALSALGPRSGRTAAAAQRLADELIGYPDPALGLLRHMRVNQEEEAR